MAEVTFIYEGVSTTIICNIDEKIRNICLKYNYLYLICSKCHLFLNNY